ncbi:ral guanine nucleotide dissociation stimulator-like isoform X1 [Meles meles]|uniref:ral guanine nucleotide dissociation stimulator-like isoform X1 n=2 Tax=Meles meles TaxID=9662 RepID=UPI001E69AEEF|nr:ral guanine nucleotide dissociation stimulator-like isoform X1 [Meles meles]XP_045837631.1 ral guanine nucleotide dissociation stimulator-like isoform X1 [Meles meles]XP_045837633.1 ral guanine nucleotide dissociation stimulator-like isoform X1 [Meles meles]
MRYFRRMEHQYQPTYVGCLGSEVKDNGRRGTEAILLSRILSLALQEQPSNKLATLVRQLQRAWKGLLKKGVVPYLGTFLTDLFMLETAMEDYLKAQEYRVLTDIMLLQAVAENYCLEPQHPFTAWFWSVERLSEDETYVLSCQQNTSARTTGHSQHQAYPIASD